MNDFQAKDQFIREAVSFQPSVTDRPSGLDPDRLKAALNLASTDDRLQQSLVMNACKTMMGMDAKTGILSRQAILDTVKLASKMSPAADRLVEQNLTNSLGLMKNGALAYSVAEYLLEKRGVSMWLVSDHGFASQTFSLSPSYKGDKPILFVPANGTFARGSYNELDSGFIGDIRAFGAHTAERGQARNDVGFTEHAKAFWERTKNETAIAEFMPSVDQAIDILKLKAKRIPLTAQPLPTRTSGNAAVMGG